ncbi:hypothetical protein B0H11DRAFT_1914019 [Mycena galericulata]|nr:hypothetical protein B0H11DRAFT_1914019 [Mycena galericulata]
MSATYWHYKSERPPSGGASSSFPPSFFALSSILPPIPCAPPIPRVARLMLAVAALVAATTEDYPTYTIPSSAVAKLIRPRPVIGTLPRALLGSADISLGIIPTNDAHMAFDERDCDTEQDVPSLAWSRRYSNRDSFLGGKLTLIAAHVPDWESSLGPYWTVKSTEHRRFELVRWTEGM